MINNRLQKKVATNSGKLLNLGKRIKELRLKFKLTQDKLSKKADIPFSTLTKIEEGYISNPSMETLIKIADAFGAGTDELLGRK